MVITIGRQFGSGGREIGKALAEELGYAFYDKELLRRAAKISGLHEEVADRFDEKPIRSLLYSAYLYSGFSAGDTVPLNQKLAFAQFDVIREAARKDNCVIIGRCANYVLQQRGNVLSVFISGDIDDRVERAVYSYGLPKEFAEKSVHKIDKSRAEYYNFFAENRWGDVSSYNMCLDSSKLGIDGCTELILRAVKLLQKKR